VILLNTGHVVYSGSADSVRDNQDLIMQNLGVF
jgi:hypothetical protein